MRPRTHRPPDDLLAAAPELAIVTIVERALEVLEIALRTEHPTLDDTWASTDPRSLQHARELLDLIDLINAAMRRYTLAVRRAVEGDSDRDLPF